jgi:hypothetical protein
MSSVQAQRNAEMFGRSETTFGYKLEQNSIRISWVKADQYADRQRCQSDAECAMAFIIWESSPFSRA